jgi:hypothetical protein
MPRKCPPERDVSHAPCSRGRFFSQNELSRSRIPAAVRVRDDSPATPCRDIGHTPFGVLAVSAGRLLPLARQGQNPAIKGSIQPSRDPRQVDPHTAQIDRHIQGCRLVAAKLVLYVCSGDGAFRRGNDDLIEAANHVTRGVKTGSRECCGWSGSTGLVNGHPPVPDRDAEIDQNKPLR